MNKAILFLSRRLLVACRWKESASHSQTSAPNSPQAISAPASATVSQPTPAVAFVSAVLGGELQTTNRTTWQRCCCVKRSVKTHCYKGSAGPEAQIRYRGGILTATCSTVSSDEDLTAFNDGTQTWTIGNEFDNDFYKEDNGFLVRHEQAEGTDGTEATADNLLLRGYMPVS